MRVVTATEAEINVHGSSLAGLKVPENVEIFTNDSSADFFVSTMAGSRLVVIPILQDSVTQAGIGVYLQAMALGKCVIVLNQSGCQRCSDGRAGHHRACGRRAGAASRDHRAWNDAAWRDRFAQAGQQYALSLGGEDELCRSVLPGARKRNPVSHSFNWG